MTIVLTVSMPARAVELPQVISREHPTIQGTLSGLAVGRDGSVFIECSVETEHSKLNE